MSITPNFPKIKPIEDSIVLNVVWKKEKRELLMDMSKCFTDEQIQSIIEKGPHIAILMKQDSEQLKAIEEILTNYSSVQFQDILDVLREEDGTFSLKRMQQQISDRRKTQIGDEGECFVYELLCEKFNGSNVKWSNYAPGNDNARIVSYKGKEYPLVTTIHNYDFAVTYNNKKFYIEVKTTTGSLINCRDFPLIFEPKEWEWIDSNMEEGASHYFVRVFDIEGSNPKAYFLKQSLTID